MSENPFRRKMEEKNKTQLLRVINNKDQFRPKAVEAAEAVLKNREKEKKKSAPADSEINSNQESSESKVKIEPRYSLRAIATYQILGSLIIAPSLFNLYPQVIGSAQNTAILVFFTLLYATGIISAILIYQKKYEGLIAALIFNMCQSFYIQIGSFAFYSTGLFSAIYIFPASFNFELLNPSFLLSFSQGGGLVIGFNLIACTAFSLLMSALIEYEEDNEFPEHLF